MNLFSVVTSTFSSSTLSKFIKSLSISLISNRPGPPIFSKISGGREIVPESSTISSLESDKSPMSTSVPCCAMKRPSRSSSERSQKEATSLLCVTRRKATSSSSCNCLNKSRTSRLVIGSSAPVGSSARISLGLVIKAREIATLCCSPPESSSGIP